MTTTNWWLASFAFALVVISIPIFALSYLMAGAIVLSSGNAIGFFVFMWEHERNFALRLRVNMLDNMDDFLNRSNPPPPPPPDDRTMN